MSLSIIWLRLPDFEARPKSRARRCPHCGSYILQRWGRITKPVRDTHELEVEVHRYRCCDCLATFRAYPEGVDRTGRTRRLRQLAALTWALGLSLDEVATIFNTFGMSLSRTTIWRDGKEIVARLPEGRRSRLVQVLSTNNGDGWIDAHQGGVVLLLELKRHKKVFLELVGETDPRSAQTWLAPLVGELGLELEIF